jgi:hypothetical protein
MKGPVKWEDLDEALREGFLDGGLTEVTLYGGHGCLDESTQRMNPFYAKSDIDAFVEKASARENNYSGYGETDGYLYSGLDWVENNAFTLKGKKIAVLGSQIPWYESICLAYDMEPITIDYTKIETDDERLSVLTVDDYKSNPVRCDLALSISSFEHSGLGRYGDPIDPDGDLKSMQDVKNNILKDGGLLVLAVPVGRDWIDFNAHRIYGPHRLKKLLEGYEILYTSFKEEDFNITHSCYQPIFVHKPKNEV